MKPSRQQDAYQLIHIIFAGIILLVFLYSAIFPPTRGEHPLPSQYEMIKDQTTASSGMSRAFSAIVRLEFRQAGDLNPHSLEVFGFFLIQLLMRVTFYWIHSLKRTKKLLVPLDAGISVILFLLCFKDLIGGIYS